MDGPETVPWLDSASPRLIGERYFSSPTTVTEFITQAQGSNLSASSLSQ
ncbi:hypothetical protein An16g07060 [Aspergillus niger]|uniref:Uncharacterized protein n=2 Tax=Aspergillus niger TaxID=5061 RepID=A2R8G4_ASPNC|nr:hypothetical protein An16g07060 [Aspergillus niger]CAL00479.1 hypothetical protein An16g07060 [Aspergillus niger]